MGWAQRAADLGLRFFVHQHESIAYVLFHRSFVRRGPVPICHPGDVLQPAEFDAMPAAFQRGVRSSAWRPFFSVASVGSFRVIIRPPCPVWFAGQKDRSVRENGSCDFTFCCSGGMVRGRGAAVTRRGWGPRVVLPARTLFGHGPDGSTAAQMESGDFPAVIVVARPAGKLRPSAATAWYMRISPSSLGGRPTEAADAGR